MSMKIIVGVLVGVIVVGCSSTKQGGNRSRTSSVQVPSNNTMYQKDTLTLTEQLELLQYAQLHRLKCNSFYSRFTIGLSKIQEQATGVKNPINDNQIRSQVNQLVDDVLNKEKERKVTIKVPSFELASINGGVNAIEDASKICIDSTLAYLNRIASLDNITYSKQEIDTSKAFMLRYFTTKNTLMLKTHTLETNEYRLHKNTSLYALDEYTFFMTRVYSFLLEANKVVSDNLADKDNTQHRNTALAMFKKLDKNRALIAKDFKMIKGLGFMLNIANYNKGDKLTGSNVLNQQQQTLAKKIDHFYPELNKIKELIEVPTINEDDVLILLSNIDIKLISHELEVYRLRLDIFNGVVETINSAKNS